MSEPKWTPAQRAAIEDRGGALLVSAAAGSGKTAVLTERAVRLITDPDHPVDADKLLIVTFTNAAAAELRARIGQALLRLSQQQPHNTSLRRQRMLLQRAPICTIDAFCLDLLHKHFQALDIPPDFAPADPGTVQLLRGAALAETLENAYRDPDFCAFADLYGKGRTDKPAGDAILQIYDFLRALPDYDRKLDEFLAPYEQENGFASTCWHDLLLAEAARCAKAARELLTAALADCHADFDQELAAAEEKKTPSARAKAQLAVAEKYEEAGTRLEKAAAFFAQAEQLAAAKALRGCVKVEIVDGVSGLYIETILHTDCDAVRVVTVGAHDHIALVEHAPFTEAPAEQESVEESGAHCGSLAEFIAFADTVALDKLAFLRDALTMNRTIYDRAMSDELAHCVLPKITLDDPSLCASAKRMAGAASYARMHGVPLPVMTATGSGTAASQAEIRASLQGVV